MYSNKNNKYSLEINMKSLFIQFVVNRKFCLKFKLKCRPLCQQWYAQIVPKRL